MGVLQAVQQVASDVVDTAGAAVTAGAKQITKTPLDILEELLGQSPAGTKPDTATPESGVDPAEMQKQAEADDQYKETQHQQLHDQIIQQSEGYYQQKKAMDAEQKQVADKQKEQERFQIKQLEKRKSTDYALQAAQDANSAEKSRNLGAG